MSDTTIVMLHGAGTESWIWDSVRSRSAAQSVALDVPSRSPNATPATCAAQLVAQLDAQLDARAAGRGHIVLVLHSLAGVLAAELARLLGDRLKACIYVAAVIPGEGSTFAKAMGFPVRFVLPILFRLNPSGLTPSESMIRGELCTDLSADDAGRVVKGYQAEFPGLYLSKVGAPPKCRSVYVKLEADKSVSPSLQRQMIARLANPEVCAIRSGHLVMLSQPAELAAIIDRVATSA